MSFTLVAFHLARAGATPALTAITPVPDPHVTIDGLNIVVPDKLDKLLGCYCSYGTGLAPGVPPLWGQLQSPGLRRIFNHDISKISNTMLDMDETQVPMYPGSPLPLTANEGLQAWTAHPALGVGMSTVGVWLCDGPAAKITGEIRTIRYTSVCAPAVGVWSLGVLGVVQQLPMGQYAVVGARVINLTESGLFRLIFTGYDWRPGGVLTHSLIVPEPGQFRGGELGVWGTFDWMHLPRIEVLSILAAPVINPDVYLDLIQIA